MAFDEQLAARMRMALSPVPDVTELKMFGGLAFMVRGHMCCGIIKDELMLRLDAGTAQAMLATPHARPMEFTGRPMVGMVMISAAGAGDDARLRDWLAVATAHAASLPPKKSKAKKAKPKKARASL